VRPVADQRTAVAGTAQCVYLAASGSAAERVARGNFRVGSGRVGDLRSCILRLGSLIRTRSGDVSIFLQFGAVAVDLRQPVRAAEPGHPVVVEDMGLRLAVDGIVNGRQHDVHLTR